MVPSRQLLCERLTHTPARRISIIKTTRFKQLKSFGAIEGAGILYTAELLFFRSWTAFGSGAAQTENAAFVYRDLAYTACEDFHVDIIVSKRFWFDLSPDQHLLNLLKLNKPTSRLVNVVQVSEPST